MIQHEKHTTVNLFFIKTAHFHIQQLEREQSFLSGKSGVPDKRANVYVNHNPHLLSIEVKLQGTSPTSHMETIAQPINQNFKEARTRLHTLITVDKCKLTCTNTSLPEIYPK